MEAADAIAYIHTLKELWHNGNHKFCHPDIRWCTSHDLLPYKLGTYMAYPVLMDSEGVICYMNEYGYGMNGDGTPSHPLQDMLGLR
jgi:hypothetical protein